MTLSRRGAVPVWGTGAPEPARAQAGRAAEPRWGPRQSITPLGIYLAVPFCRSKCSFCNFASQVYAPGIYAEYATLLAREIALTAAASDSTGCDRRRVDSIYWGGGTPSLLPPPALAAILGALGEHFQFEPNCEHTMEVAPGTLTPELLDLLPRLSPPVNRISLGVQSFQDEETRAVGRLHRRSTVVDDIARLRAAGIANFNLDLIAGLPHQTPASWRESLDLALEQEPPHLSVYMLEVDDDSRLGHELLAGGVRYHAHLVPDDDAIADAYELAWERLAAAGRPGYEISNFAQPGAESRHNLKYWTRRPYLGFGVDAHSFVETPTPVRYANPDTLTAYCEPLRQGRLPRGAAAPVSARAAAEEFLFLGLRLARGLSREAIAAAAAPVAGYAEWLEPRFQAQLAAGLIEEHEGRIALTPRGRLLSNRVFAEFLA